MAEMMSKTPEKIKIGLEHCSGINACAECVYDKRNFPHCVVRMCKDALAYIHQLEAENLKLLNSYDAALCESADAYEERKEAEAQVPKWNSVKDRLPESRGNILFLHSIGLKE